MSDRTAPYVPKRRTLYFLTDAGFQARFVGYFILLFLALVAVNVFTFKHIAQIALDNAMDMGIQPGHPYYEAVQDQVATMWRIMQISWVAVLCILLLAALLISYRIIGPILHLKRHLEEVAAGKTTDDVHFRKHDFFLDLAVSANRVLARLRGRAH
jgi:methyl-accepting chemotaxis protein